MTVDKLRKRKREFQRKWNRFKLSREKIDVTEQLKFVLQIKVLFVGTSVCIARC